MRKLIRVSALLIILALLVPPSSSIASSKNNQPQQNVATLAIHTLHAPTVPSVGESATNSLPYYLSNTNVADAPYGSTTLVLDGMLSPGEYAHAHRLTFPTYGGEAEVFIIQNALTLTIGIDSPDTTPYPYNSGEGMGPALQVFVDTNHDLGTAPKTDDYRLTILKNGDTLESQGTGSVWANMPSPDGWKAAKQDTSWGWQAEFSIGFNKLGMTSPVATSRTIGLALAEVWTQPHTLYNPKDWYWPTAATYNRPDTWAHLISSSWWSTFYWKPGPWEDYAPSGIPDFDQQQDAWQALGPGPGGPPVPIWSHCGPVAVANSLWWFDSKFETPDHSPGKTISDTYPLVQSYGASWDDHDPQNVIPFVDDLANNYFETNNGMVGTDILKMNAGLQKYLREKGLWDDYSVTLVKKPSFAWVADEVQRSEDVVLLLGFWQLTSQDYYQRVGGHYVTVAGVDLQQQQIAFSDPFLDYAESNPGAGYVYTGTLITHSPVPGHTHDVHNDAGNVSHDVYATLPVPPTWNTPGTWMLPNYPALLPLFGANPHPDFPNQQYIPGPTHPVFAVVEFALAVSPYNWKASGWKDYAPNSVPDIGQKQDAWKTSNQQWTYCAPVAAANSIWWFDSKFEPSPVAPPAYNDNYPLIKSYDPDYPPWDDHNPKNVDNGFGEQFVDDLAAEFKTDVAGPGTVITDVRTGIVNYMKERVIDSRYTVKQVKAPDFWWVADEVERSEDVILLLGFWEGGVTGQYHRLGGHYVTISGVDKKGGEIAFSDPWFNRIEQSWPYAGTPAPGVGVPTCDPCYMGRVADGTLITPHTIPHPVGLIETLHNDAGNVSHDIYYVTSTTSPGGSWGPLAYANSWGDIENFWMQNGGGTSSSGGTIQTEVEWAIAVSPATTIFLPVVMR